jgi:glycolate oxidase FAD binding subunit
VEYSPVDLTIAVEAGAPLSAIDGLLAEHGQRLALDMPHRDRATIGGAFAAGLSGPRRLRYGSLKDMVIGAEVVNRRGEIAKSGGMVVKNVSGYEVARLHYGAHGAFGVVSRLNLKVLPAPESRVEVRLLFERASGASQAGSAVLVSALDPAAVYVVRGTERAWELRVQLEGSERFTTSQARRVFDLATGAQSVDVVRVEGASTPAFDAISDLTDDAVAVARVSAPASTQAEILERMGELDAVEVFADMGSGLIYLRGTFDDGWLELVGDLDKPTVFLALPNAAKKSIDVFGTMDANGNQVLRRLKEQYDPEGLFNPGRFVSFL